MGCRCKYRLPFHPSGPDSSLSNFVQEVCAAKKKVTSERKEIGFHKGRFEKMFTETPMEEARIGEI